MEWKNVKTIYNRRNGLYTLKSVQNKEAETFTIPKFVNFAVKKFCIDSIDWESFENKISGQTVSSVEVCEQIYDLGGMMPQRFLEQLLRYEGIQHDKIKKKFENDKIIFHFPSDCKLKRIKGLLSPKIINEVENNNEMENKEEVQMNESD